MQLNAQHSRSATANLQKTLYEFRGPCVALIQEPWVYKDNVRGLNSPDRTLFATKNRGRPRAAISCSKCLQPALIPQLCTPDLTVIQIQVPTLNVGLKTLLLASAYHHLEIPLVQTGIEHLVDYCRSKRLPYVIGMDANAHHTVWGSTNINNRGDELLNFILSSNSELLNKGNVPTFTTSCRKEVLDVTIASTEGATMINNWHVSMEDSLSDHRQIHFEILSSKIPRKWMRDPRKTDWNAYCTRLNRNLPRMPQVRNLKIMIDELAKDIENAITQAYNFACPSRPCSQRKQPLWWNENSTDLNAKRSVTRATFKTAIASQAVADWTTYRIARREYKTAIQKAKRTSWANFCQGVESTSEMARLSKILRKETSSEVGMMKLPNGDFTTNYGEVVEHMLKVHFPNCMVGGQTHFEPRNPTKQCWREVAKTVTASRVKWAISDMEPYKAPGPDGIYPILLQKGIEILTPYLVCLYRASLAIGYIPKAWQTVRVVFIPKPGKEDYSVAKSFRPISLASFMLKALEKLVDRRLKDSCMIVHPLHERQHAYQSGKSTETALHELVMQIENTFDRGEYALACFLDIEGAFDNAQFDDIRNALITRGVPSVLVDWSTSMLSQRVIQTKVGDSQCEAVAQQGTAQGGVLSALFWVLVVDELLTNLSQAHFDALGYSDDITIVLKGPRLDVLCEQMQLALRCVERWCTDRKMRVNPSKTELMIFTRKRKVEGILPIRLLMTELELTTRVKYLGVVLDSKLTWNDHIEHKCKKAVNALFQCRSAMGKRWGSTPRTAHWLYTAVIRPALTYGAVVWWTGAQKATMARKLSKIQRTACLCITGAMCSAPTAALQVICGILPLDLQIQTEAMKTAYRFSQLGLQPNRQKWNIGHMQIWRYLLRIPVTCMNTDFMKAEYYFDHAYSTKVPDRREWLEGEIMDNQAVNTCFTDGSKQDENPNNPNHPQWAGAGIYSETASLQESVPLGQYTTVFQAEVFAIQSCAELLTMRPIMESVVINTDSQAAIGALHKPRITSKVVLNARNALNHLAGMCKTTIRWVPGHTNIEGNEKADALAKAAAKPSILPIQLIGVSPAVGKLAIREWARSAHSQRWRAEKQCRQTKMNIVDLPKLSMSRWYMSLNREDARLLSCILTGHCFLNRHLFLLKLVPSRKCDTCKKCDETLHHFLCECPRYAKHRYDILGKANLDPSQSFRLRWKDLIKFVRKTDRSVA